MADLSIANNLLVIYTRKPTDIAADADESVLPDFMQKYIEYGVAARALWANTDGQLAALADYWELRRQAAYQVIQKFKILRLADRKLQFATRVGAPSRMRHRHPRLPSNYNDPYV